MSFEENNKQKIFVEFGPGLYQIVVIQRIPV